MIFVFFHQKYENKLAFLEENRLKLASFTLEHYKEEEKKKTGLNFFKNSQFLSFYEPNLKQLLHQSTQ